MNVHFAMMYIPVLFCVTFVTIVMVEFLSIQVFFMFGIVIYYIFGRIPVISLADWCHMMIR